MILSLSPKTTGHGAGVVCSLSLHNFPTTIPEKGPNKKAKYKSARCYSRGKKNVYTSDTALSASCGCAKLESDAPTVLCHGMLNTYQNRINFISVLLLSLISLYALWHPLDPLEISV